MAAAATMFAACSQTDFVNEAAVVESNASQTIGFEGFAGKSTRAEIADLDALKNVGFNVWGYTGSTAEDVVFNGDNVDWVTVEGTLKWSYAHDETTLKPWEEDKTYLFGAIAPQTATGSLSHEGVYSIGGAQSGYAADVTDYLVAETQTIPSSAARLVTLDFKHIMSKVSVTVTGSADVTINRIQMKGWKTGAGTFASNATPTWTITGDGTADYTDVYNAGAGVYNATTTATDDAASFLIVPQTATLTFLLTYKVGALEYEKPVEVASQVLAQNTHTTFNFTVGAAYIEFSAAMTTGWTTTDVDKTIEN